MNRSLAIAPVRLPDGRDLAVEIIHSTRAARLAIRIRNWSAVELIIPHRVSTGAAMSFLASRLDWVVARLASLPAPIALQPGTELPLLGVPHILRHVEFNGRGAFRIEAGEIAIPGAIEHFGRRAKDGLRAHARKLLMEKTYRQAATIGKPVGRIAVRDMRTRWGSCSGSGRIAYSWRLVLAPEWIMDYVVCHETAHLVEMNHQRPFWHLVERLYPDYRTAQLWLKRHGSDLHRFG